MANVRQMPELYLRGSLANITMKNLSGEQQTHVANLIEQICSHPEMQRHRIKVMKELGVTIAADYSDDRQAAEQEYRVAVWRGVVDLFYHRKYTFECRACNSSVYFTKRSKAKAIDRVQTPCPNCRCVEIDSPGDVAALQERAQRGERYLTIEEFQESYKDQPDGYAAPTCKSSIIYKPGEKKYENPQAIIDDEKQLRKFFGEFVWNYFRQQINENKRKEHRKDPIPLLGTTDWLLVQEVLSLCNQMGVDYNYCEKLEPQGGMYTIKLSGLTTPPEFTAEFARLRAKAAWYGVKMAADAQAVTVAVTIDAHPMPVYEEEKQGKPTGVKWQIKVIKPEHVSVLDNLATSSESDTDFTITQVNYRTVGGQRMDTENHVDLVDNGEAMVAIRDSLPEGQCRTVFDILSQQGDAFLDFSEKYGDGDARDNHIAAFLGITPRAVKNYKELIEVNCLARDFVPAD